MAQYRTSQQTREKILNAARAIFYDKGYEAATYMGICSAAGVNAGTLHYHYGSKGAVGKEINREIVRHDFHDAVSLLDEAQAGLGKDSNAVFTAYNYVYWFKFFESVPFRRFCTQIMSEYRDCSPQEYYDTFYPEEIFGRTPETNLQDLHFAVYLGMDLTLPVYVEKNLDSYSFRDIGDYCIRTVTALEGFSLKEIQKLSRKVGRLITDEKLAALPVTF